MILENKILKLNCQNLHFLAKINFEKIRCIPVEFISQKAKECNTKIKTWIIFFYEEI